MRVSVLRLKNVTCKRMKFNLKRQEMNMGTVQVWEQKMYKD